MVSHNWSEKGRILTKIKLYHSFWYLKSIEVLFDNREVRGHAKRERLLCWTVAPPCTLNVRQTVVTVRRSAEQRLAIPDFHMEEGRRASARGRGTDACGAW